MLAPAQDTVIRAGGADLGEQPQRLGQARIDGGREQEESQEALREVRIKYDTDELDHVPSGHWSEGR